MNSFIGSSPFTKLFSRQYTTCRPCSRARPCTVVECKKGTKQRAPARRRENQRGGSTVPDGPARPPALDDIDFESVESVEVQGNKVIITMDEGEANHEAQLESDMHVMDSVVKIFCVHTEPNFSLPWQRKRQYSSTSSGFMVEGPTGQRWLLTNAHSVEYHSQVKVKKRGDDRKYLARVLAIGTECDIALLTVDDPFFWEDGTLVQWGGLPTLQEPVFVVGYPIGGDTISVTSGVVSRIEVTAYAHGATELLAIQTSAPINSGNSGGPAFTETGECLGIAFQSYAGSDAENIGYIIPVPVIQHFLDDYERNGGFTGFPALGILWQRMESDALRASCGMAKEQKGVLVRTVQPISYVAELLQPDDILMSFDGVQVANDGTVPFRSGERIAFSYLTSQKFTGDVCTLDVLRQGKGLSIQAKLMKPNALVPHHLAGQDPSYMVVAGFVLTTLTEPYLRSEYGLDYHSSAPVRLLDKLLHGHKKWSDEEIVLVSQVLACDATLGYEDCYNTQVHKFNGVPVRNLRHLAEMILNCSEDYMRFDVEYHGPLSFWGLMKRMQELLVLENRGAVAATTEVLRAHSIPSMVSKDLLDSLQRDVEAWIQSKSTEEGENDVPMMALMGSKGLHEYRLAGTTPNSMEP